MSAELAFQIGHGVGADGKALFENGSFAQYMAHGASQGIVSMMRGQKFEYGFVSGLVGKIGGGVAESYFPGVGMGDMLGKASVIGLFGGIASEAVGGDFYEGAVEAAFVYLYNDLSDRVKYNRSQRFRDLYLQKQANIRAQQKLESNKPTIFHIGLDNLSSKDKLIWERRMAINKLQYRHIQDHKLTCTCGPTSNQVGLALSVAAMVFPGAWGYSLGAAAIILDLSEPDYTGAMIGVAAMTPIPYAGAADIGYGIYQILTEGEE